MTPILEALFVDVGLSYSSSSISALAEVLEARVCPNFDIDYETLHHVGLERIQWPHRKEPSYETNRYFTWIGNVDMRGCYCIRMTG